MNPGRKRNLNNYILIIKISA